MAVKLGFSTTKLVNGETVADYATEATNNNTTIGKMINATNEYLKRMGVKGTGGVVGTYDANLIGECCHKLFNGSVHADTGYGVVVSRQYYETAKLI
ncbi:hypothetical protein SD70_27215 [Gordoniibacillus kamchatkensis]|uniref:Uncharacterized protein n=1 Tax=Gordoniibacillus kamchatkensis TaxID=1590651 RepID=A0ABR5ABB4_9BACL|nr:hypothetical protein [Paenibacillus sp. VKM B-2647]KIL38308.1 hypothetical protein SD70_27215 [Paenibacillus sp. VKM B-2647]